MSKLIHVSKLTIFPVLLALIAILFVVIKIPVLLERDQVIETNAEDAKVLAEEKSIIQTSSTALVIWDKDGKVVSASSEVSDNIVHRDIVGSDISELIDSDSASPSLRTVKGYHAFVSGTPGKGGVALIKPDLSCESGRRILQLQEEIEKIRRNNKK